MLKCEIEKLNWTTCYSYKTREGKNIDLTLPFETMQKICCRYRLEPELGAGEASFAAFRDWLYRHRRTRDEFYGKKGFDIKSLVGLFDDDLQGTAILMKEARK